MAFESVEQKFKKANDIKVGESIEGFVIGKHNGGRFPNVDCIRMKVGNENIILTGNGTLKYFFENGNKAGFYYRFTRVEDKKNKLGQVVSQWKIEIDRSRTCEVEAPVVEAPKTDVAAATEHIPF